MIEIVKRFLKTENIWNGLLQAGQAAIEVSELGTFS